MLTFFSLLLSAISAVLALAPYYFIWKIIKEVLDIMPNFSRQTAIVQNAWFAVLSALLSMLIYIAALMCSHIAAFRVQANLRKSLMRHIVALPSGSIEAIGSGKIRQTVNECSASTESYLAHQLPDMARAIVTPIVLLIMLFAFDWRFGLFSLIPVGISFLIMMVFMTGPSLKEKMQEYQNALDNMSNEAVEYIRGIPVVKTFGQTFFSFKKFKTSIDSYSQWSIAYTRDLRIPMCLLTMFVNGIFAFIMIAAMLFSGNGITNELLLNVLFYVIITPALTVTMTKIMFQSENKMLVEDSLGRIDRLLALKPLTDNGSETPANASIELSDVTYSYDRTKNALDHISLRINSGETVAFVGPSGGGKTTLANIICRFFDPESGSVRIGGADVKQIDKDRLMDTISFVFQNSRMIKASVLNNIRLGNPDASREEVQSALSRAQCDDIIAKLPDGIETVIGTDGVFLSGGEMQRLALARALLKNAPIVILDEATAFADPDNESRVQKAFEELSKEKTVIMIAHRLSSIANVDKIFVLKDGQIVEHGTKEQLIKQHGLFEKMFLDYQRSVSWKVAKEAK